MSAETDPAPRPLVEALRNKSKHLEEELEAAEDRIDELEAETEHLRNRLEKIEDELGVGGEAWR